jgi:hypothetical protein
VTQPVIGVDTKVLPSELLEGSAVEFDPAHCRVEALQVT